MGNIWAAIITVGGMVLVTLFNLLGTKWSVRQEAKRLQSHLIKDWRLQQFREWERELRDCLAKLIAAADPQLPGRYDYAHIIALVHRSQLLLDDKDPHQALLNNAINKLALTVTGWGSEELDKRQLLPLQDGVILASKSVLYNPLNSTMAVDPD